VGFSETSKGKGGGARRNWERSYYETAVKNLPGGGLFPSICRCNPFRRPEGEGARRKRAGFTLVEVIVVLVILAILAAIAIPALTGYIDKANTSQIKAKARTAAIALQTILSEAYADPQTYLPVGGEGQLFLNGTSVTRIDDADRDEAPGTYTLTGMNEAGFLNTFRKLDASSIIPLEEGPEGKKRSAIFNVLFDEHFSLLAYSYLDPETYSTDDMRSCTYNYLLNEENNGFVYDPSAGFKVWGADADDNPVPIG
jgi:type IV pilus assembly protein PilA